ncbi:hypothetical protein [Deinococcus yavapaiensis]|uniref:2'-5' RNA ligase superfamily protein n=1 Tax=Deinococcus yavapaiensis KR-236 TaxID=694435 RepID=A0A318SFD4_9DEIO|nr:hypothetical protein [Deinococcus yavapaiensis]PYE55945.1 hypothetical protein DES52_102312 [Deinococcus yavapaiensis KR-236]
MSAPADSVRFAVYLVPPAEDPYYRLGSAALGYDVRARRDVERLPGTRAEWVSKAGPFGFHATIVEAFDCAPSSFPDIEREIEACLASLSPSSVLELSNGRIETWDGGEVIVHRFDPNSALHALHVLLLARLGRFVTGSSFERAMRSGEKYQEPHQKARIALLHTPRGLDTWEPHFTLADPYGGGDAEGLAADFDERFELYSTLKFDTVTLLRQNGTQPYEIVRDFPVRDSSVNSGSQQTS